MIGLLIEGVGNMEVLRILFFVFLLGYPLVYDRLPQARQEGFSPVEIVTQAKN